MKKLLTITMLLLVVMACKNEKKDIKKDAKKDISENTFLTATINGEKFSSTVRIVTFRANNQTYLTTADNSDALEYSFRLSIEKNKDSNPLLQYSFIEKEDENGKNIAWRLPNDFNFNSTKSGKYLEGTFSFTANAFNGISEDATNQLIVTNGKFKAFRTNY